MKTGTPEWNADRKWADAALGCQGEHASTMATGYGPENWGFRSMTNQSTGSASGATRWQ